MSACLWRIIPWTAGLALGLVAPLPAAPPAREELLRYVPDDVGFCLIVQGVRAHGANLAGSPFADHLRRSPLGAVLSNSAELRRLEKAEKLLQTLLGFGWAELRDLLGEAVVFAYRPGPPGKPEQEQGLVLLRARTPRVLAVVVERFNEAQKATGELKELTERDYKGVKYFRRVERKEVNFYLLRGPVLVFSGKEEMLRQAIDRDRAVSAGAEPAVALRLRELGLERALLALWINPRAFDADVQARAVRSADAGARTFAAIWKALQSIGLAVNLDRDLALTLAVRARPDELPASARRFLTEAARPSELWRSFPEDALFAAAGRFDVAALFEFLTEFMSKEARQALSADLNRTLGAALGKDVVKEVLPALGPDWGLCLSAPPAEAKSWAPRLLVALRLAPAEKSAAEAGAGVDQAVLSAVNSWALLAVLGHNKKHADQPVSLKTLMADRQPIKYVAGEGAFPPGVQPAFALKSGYLVLASSPDGVRRFSPTGGEPPAGTPLLRISVKSWRAFLKDRREALAGLLAGRERISPEQARARLDELRAGLEMVDRLELRQKTAAGQVTFTLAVQPAWPLRK
jgi:hypothetical protein